MIPSKNQPAVAAATVCFTSFALACGVFAAAVLFLIPLTAGLCQAIAAPDLLTQTTILTELIGLPIIGAIAGIEIGARLIGE